MRLPYSTAFCMNTRLDAQTISDRLRSGISNSKVARSSRIRGWVDADRWVLKGPVLFGTRNSFLRLLEIRLYPSAQGTELRGHFRLSWPTFYFMCAWFGSLSMGVLATIVALVTKRDSSDAAVPFGFVILILFGWGMIKIGVWLSRSNEEKLVDFLHQTLDQLQNNVKLVS
jgi:hypothetical protein